MHEKLVKSGRRRERPGCLGVKERKNIFQFLPVCFF